jgi:putative transposase
MVNKDHPKLSLTKQCDLLNIHRSGTYYQIKGESKLNLKLMRLIDEHYLDHPEKGARRMWVWLTKDLGYKVSLNRIERLFYRVMCLNAIMPGPHTSKRNKDHKVYPYLLRDLKIERVNQVWAIDITYIPMNKGFMYLIAIIDLYSRYVVGWSVSNTMDAQWCKQCLENSIKINGKPEIINTDQGSQFTSTVFTKFVLNEAKVKLSMDGKGRATDNAFIERLWRSVKYEKLYLEPPTDGTDLWYKISEYMDYYNNERRHSSIGDQKPKELYIKQLKEAA